MNKIKSMLFIAVLFSIVGVVSNAYPFSVPATLVNYPEKSVAYAKGNISVYETKFAPDADTILSNDFISHALKIDSDLSVRTISNDIKRAISVAISKNGKYYGLSYMDSNERAHTVVFNEKGDKIFDIEKYYLIKHIDENGEYVVCEDYGLNTLIVKSGDDYEPEKVFLDILDNKGKVTKRINISSFSFRNINLINDENYICLKAKGGPTGAVLDLNGSKVFPSLEEKGIGVFQVKSGSRDFLGYKSIDKNKGILSLIDGNGNIIWSKERANINNCVLSGNGKYIYGISEYQTDKVVGELETEVTYPSYKKIKISQYEKVETMFLYDIEGNLLWEKKMDIFLEEDRELDSVMSNNGQYIIVIEGPPTYGKDDKKLVCIDNNGTVLWETAELDIVVAYISGNGKNIYAVGPNNIYKFKNIAMRKK